MPQTERKSLICFGNGHIHVRKGVKYTKKSHACPKRFQTHGGVGAQHHQEKSQRCVSNMTGSVPKREGVSEIHHESSQTRLEGSQSSRNSITLASKGH